MNHTCRLNHAMANSEYQTELNPSINLEVIETIGEEIAPITRPSPSDLNNDHLHQLITFLKGNLTSTFPFALIHILKAFYEHSAGSFKLDIGLIRWFALLSRNAHGDLLFCEFLSRQYRFGSTNCIEIFASLSFLVFLFVDLYRHKKILFVFDLRTTELSQMGFVDVTLGSLFHVLHR